MGFKLIYIERAFELTINDLKTYSPEKLALLRIIKCYPGIVAIADNNFKQCRYTDLKMMI